RLEALQQVLEALKVHRLIQAVRNDLIDQRVLGYLAVTTEVFGASQLIGKNAADQIFGGHARQLRWHFFAAAKTRDRQRHAGNPAPTRNEHWGIEQRLDQHVLDGGGVEVAHHLSQFEAMRRGQRKDDAVLSRRRLQLEIEFAAEAFAQRQTPGAIDAAAVGGMDHQLHAA